MKLYIDADFMAYFRRLPKIVQEQARAKYRLFKTNPYHSSLQFKKVSQIEPIYSVRINVDYRALGIWEGERIDWFWIGPHAEYDDLIGHF